MKNNYIPLSEYPRPQFIRESYYCLNGEWDYAFSEKKEFPTNYEGKIIVPYSPEAPLSNVNRVLKPNEFLFYRKSFNLTEEFNKDYLIIHFGAVDQIADVYFNDELMITHIGGFLPFEIKIPHEKLKDTNEIKVRVRDTTDTRFYSRGKQSLSPGGIWYSPSSGIYMPVWMEAVHKGYFEGITITPNIDKCSVTINVKSLLSYFTLKLNNQTYELLANKDNEIRIEDPLLWSPETPYLYDFVIKNDVDEVKSYFALRKFSLIDDGKHLRLALNNKPYFMKGVLDQGYYQEGMLTPPTIDEYKEDLELIKELGFNTVRKHIKIESLIWYHYCDKLGLIVWQDFVNGGEKYHFPTIAFPLFTHRHHDDHNYIKFARLNEEGKQLAIQEFKDTISYLYNVPSIALWTIFNEGWGQFDAKEIYFELVKLDETRLFDHASGWHDQGVSDVKSIHVYFTNFKMPKEKYIKHRAVILSECGGYNYKIEGHTFNNVNFGYKKVKTETAFIKAYQKFINKNIFNNIAKGLSAFIYTQLSDVEEELNGFITYDREVIKVDPKQIKRINDTLFYKGKKHE